MSGPRATAQEDGEGPALQARFIGTPEDCERAVQALRNAGFDMARVSQARGCDTVGAVMVYAYPPTLPERRPQSSRQRPRERRGR